MSGEPILTIVGTLGGDPELRFVPTGAAVCSFSVASTPRNLDKASDTWKDGETIWFNCSVWRKQAECVAETLQKGMRVIVTGRLKARSWEDKDGNKRTSMEVDVDEVGPSLRYASAKVTKAERDRPKEPANDPWSTPADSAPPW